MVLYLADGMQIPAVVFAFQYEVFFEKDLVLDLGLVDVLDLNLAVLAYP